MAKEQKDTDQAVEEPTEFPVTLTEYLSEIPQAQTELKCGFNRLCQTEGLTGSKMRAEWQRLFDLFKTKPTAIKWSLWASKGGK